MQWPKEEALEIASEDARPKVAEDPVFARLHGAKKSHVRIQQGGVQHMTLTAGWIAWSRSLTSRCCI